MRLDVEECHAVVCGARFGPVENKRDVAKEKTGFISYVWMVTCSKTHPNLKLNCWWLSCTVCNLSITRKQTMGGSINIVLTELLLV